MKAIRLICCVFLLLFVSDALAGNENQPIGGRRISLGSAYTGVRGDYWSMYANPAGMAGMKQMQAGLFLERRFLMSEMNLGTVGFVLPFQTRHYAGVDFGGFGFGGYTESHIGLSYAASVLEQLSLGVKLQYARTSIQNYGSGGALIIDAGINAQIMKGLSVGASVFNANQAKLDTEIGEQIPSTFAFGLAYQASDKVLLVADLEKQVNFPYSFRGGIEYAILPILKARIGASTQPVTLNAGLGLSLKKGFDIDWANSYHEYLGYTPSLSLSYRFGSTESKEAAE